MQLMDVYREQLLRGYHHSRIRPLTKYERDQFLTDDEAKEVVDESRAELANLEPDDLVVFHSLTPHRSAPNRSSEPKRLLLLRYNAVKYGNLYAKYYVRNFKRKLGIRNYRKLVYRCKKIEIITSPAAFFA